MNGLTAFLRGYCVLTVTGGSTEWLLNRLTHRRIPFWGLTTRDAFTIQFCVFAQDCAAVSALSERVGCEVVLSNQNGLPFRFAVLKKRTALLLLLAASVLGALVIPSFVWFYRVEGNEAVPSAQILRAVQDAGVTVGTYGPDIHPQQVRYRVLAKLPQLRWLTVTQSGGCAVISVRENEPPPAPIDRKAPRNLVAGIGGMVTDISALDGEARVQKGEIVTPGQVLISGTMDLEYATRICRAEGEVYARTWREIGAVFPKTALRKDKVTRKKTLYYLKIGKMRIKLSLGSGFSAGVCDKMSVTKPLTLPGGYTLPVALTEETLVFFDAVPAVTDAAAAYDAMQRDIEAQVHREMIAGSILKSSLRTGEANGVYTLTEKTECEEMIARPQAENTKDVDADGRTDYRRGTDGAAH